MMMTKKFLKLGGIFIAVIFTLVVIGGLLFRIYSPKYFIPYVIEQVSEETNGRYTLAINSDSVRVRILTMNLNLGHTEFKRDSSVITNSGIDFLDKFEVYAQFESLEINALRLVKFLFNNKIWLEEVILQKPVLVIKKNINYHPDDFGNEKQHRISPTTINYEADNILTDTLALDQLHYSIGAVTPYIRVDTFRIEKASYAFYDGRKNDPIQEVYGLDFNLMGFVLDESDDIEVEDASIHIDSASSLDSKNIARLKVKGVQIHPDSVHLDQLHFGHIVDPYSINSIKGFRSSWLNIAVENIDMKGINPSKLLSDSVLNIDKTSIGYINLHLFKDKEDPVINPAHKALPSEEVRHIPVPVMVDTFTINNGRFVIDMEAPAATKPGRLIIEDINAQILNITNMPAELEKSPNMVFNAYFKLDDSIEVDLKIDFVIPSSEDQFHVTCDVKPFSATTLNSFLGSQFFIEFPSGIIKYLHFEYDGNNKANVGTMDIEYENLKVRKLQDYQKYMEGKPNTGFVAGIGNILIPANRSIQSKNYKQAVIYYEKEYNRDFIHGTIMSLVSGVTSSVGFASKNLEKKRQIASELDGTSTQLSEEKAQQKAKKAAMIEKKQK